MGASANSTPYKPITDPYSSDVQVPDLSGQQKATMDAINGKYSGVRNQTRAGLQAQGVGGTELNSGLNKDYAQQAGDVENANSALQQQDMNNRLQAMSGINAANYNKAKTDQENAQNSAAQQNSQVSGGVGTAMSVASLLAMLL